MARWHPGHLGTALTTERAILLSMVEPEPPRSEVGRPRRSEVADELAAVTKDGVVAASAWGRTAESVQHKAEATLQRAEARLRRSEALRERTEAALQRAEATLQRAEASLRRFRADERDRVADTREAEADERDRVADSREAAADASHVSIARAIVDVAQLGDRLAAQADTIAAYFEEHGRDRGDADRRAAFARAEREIADVLRRNAASLRAGGHPRLEHLPELPAPP